MTLVDHIVIRDMNGRNPITTRLDEMQQALRKQVIRIETNFYVGIRGDDAQQLGGIPSKACARQIFDTELRANACRRLTQHPDRGDAIQDALFTLFGSNSPQIAIISVRNPLLAIRALSLSTEISSVRENGK